MYLMARYCIYLLFLLYHWQEYSKRHTCRIWKKTSLKMHELGWWGVSLPEICVLQNSYGEATYGI